MRQMKGDNTCLPTITSGNYSYTLTPDDLKQEQTAFEPGEGVTAQHGITCMYIYMYTYRGVQG